jgi:hypothetical protein
MDKNSTPPTKQTKMFDRFKDLLQKTFTMSEIDSFQDTTGNSDLDSIIFNPKRNKEERINDLIHYIRHLFDALQGAVYLYSKDSANEPKLKCIAKSTTDGKLFNKQICTSKGMIRHTYLKKKSLRKISIPPDYSSIMFFENEPVYIYTLPVVVFGRLAGMTEIAIQNRLTTLQINKLKGIIRNSAEHLISR